MRADLELVMLKSEDVITASSGGFGTCGNGDNTISGGCENIPIDTMVL